MPGCDLKIQCGGNRWCSERGEESGSTEWKKVGKDVTRVQGLEKKGKSRGKKEGKLLGSVKRQTDGKLLGWGSKKGWRKRRENIWKSKVVVVRDLNKLGQDWTDRERKKMRELWCFNCTCGVVPGMVMSVCQLPWFRQKYPNNFWMDWHETLYRHPWSSEDVP